MHSLELSGARLHRALETLVGAGRALMTCSDLGEALTQIAGRFVSDFGGYCSIEIADAGLVRGGIRVTAGTITAEQQASKRLIVEPLSDGRSALGTIACLPDPKGEDSLVRQVLAVLATELGVVVAAQLMLQREHRVADRLQRALLPDRLPQVLGTVFHAAYRPAGDEAAVGGDWYDAFTLPDERVAISIGDVAGHGLEAAIVMGEVRQAIRSTAVANDSPAGVLESVNRVVGMREMIGIITAIFGIYDPADGTLVYAVAGHPPPILALANGCVLRLPSGSLPLGCTDTLDCKEWTFTIPDGAHAIFYTDGLIENERDLIAGEKRLGSAVRRLLNDRRNGTPAVDLASAILEHILSETGNRDDAATLVLSRAAPVPSYVFSAVPATAAVARAVVSEELTRHGIEGERQFGVLLALGEAVANAIEHAYHGGSPGLLRLDLQRGAGHLTIAVEDFGRWRPFVRKEERGRGIDLMHQFVDSVQIRSTATSTRVLLTAKLSA